jgi:shikimate 5-dehydrogenase
MHQASINALKIEAQYQALHIPKGHISLIKKYQKEFCGFNVTIPHKQSVMKYVDQLTPAAKRIGAVNTLYLKKGKWIGDNTDAPGFLMSLKKLFPGQKIKVDSKDKDHTVVTVLQPCYILNGKIIRIAKVTVGQYEESH